MLNFQVLVMSECNEIVFNYNSNSEFVDDNVLLECIINCVMKDIGEDEKDEELVDEMMRIGGEIYDSRIDMGNSFMFKLVDDDFIEFYVVSVVK